MKRFILKLLSLCILFAVIVVGMHVYAILKLSSKVDEVYNFQGDCSCDVLFLGASQIGCSISTEPRFHNRVIWVSSSVSQSCLARLRELERRGQLKCIKTCVVPFNEISIMQQEHDTLLWAWYLELPVTWRSFDLLPVKIWEFLCYVARNLRSPLPMRVCEIPPMEVALTDRMSDVRRRMYDKYETWARNIKDVAGTVSGWESQFFGCYREMNEICKRNGIRFAVCRPPMLAMCKESEPARAKEQLRTHLNALKELGIEYVDVGSELPDSCFMDNVHLTRKGAERYTCDLYARMGLKCD